MTLVSQRMHRNHLISICPSIMQDGATETVTLSIITPDGSRETEWTATGTEDQIFAFGKSEVDNLLAECDDDPDGDFARRWRKQQGYPDE